MNWGVKYILVLFILSLQISASGQCPTVDFVAQDSVCIGEDMVFTNNTTGATSYEWDFCPGILLDTPDVELIASISGLNTAVAYTTVTDGVNWYGFIPNRGGNNLVRVDFGADLKNDNPTTVNLGNISGLMSLPDRMKIIKEGSNWVGLMCNASNNLLRIDFGNSLANAPTADDLGTFGGKLIAPRGIDIKIDGEDVVAVVSSSNAAQAHITMINFGNSIYNNPANEDAINSLPTENGTLVDMTLIKDCDQWYGLATSKDVNLIHKFHFGNSLFQVPTREDYHTEVTGFIGKPASVEVRHDGESYKALFHTEGGQLFILDFGTSMSATPTLQYEINRDDIPGNWNNKLGFDIVKYNGEWVGHAISFTSGSVDFHRFTFSLVCSANTISSTDTSPLGINFTAGGTHHYGLTAYDTEGDVSHMFDSVYVPFFPEPDFRVDKRCINQPTLFFDSTQTSGSDVVSWSWDFDDPGSGVDNTSILPNPGHTYLLGGGGSYNVFMSVTDDCGNTVDTTKAVQMFDDTDIVVDLYVPDSACSNDSIILLDSSTYTFDQIVQWQWDMDDGVGTSSMQNVTYAYLDSGSYNVRLTVTGESGCSYDTTSFIRVNIGAKVNFNFENECLNTPISFMDSSQGEGIISRLWDFGDGFSSILENPQHVYASPDEYDISLTVGNDGNCVNTITKSATVYALPLAGFTNEVACSNLSTQFFDESVVANANITAWSWVIGNDTLIDEDPTYIFTDSGSFEVTLSSTSNFGCVDTAARTLEVRTSPIVDFTFNESCFGDSTYFVDTIALAEGDTVSFLSWDIDETIYNTENPAHLFSTPNTFDVNFVVASSNLCVSSLTKQVIIDTLPIIDVTYQGLCANEETQIQTSQTHYTDSIISWEWNIESVGNSFSRNPSFQFGTEGNYSAILRAITWQGCEIWDTTSIHINDVPDAEILADLNIGPPPLTVNLVGSSVLGTYNDWYLGDSSISNDEDIDIVIDSLGNHTITLIVTNDSSCIDTVSHVVEVIEGNMETSLDELSAIFGDNDMQLFATFSNIGNVTINELSTELALGSDLTINQDFDQDIGIGETITFPVNLNIGGINETTPFVCLSLVPRHEHYQENDSSDNLACISISELAHFYEPSPNPADNEVHVEFYIPTIKDVDLKIVGSNGSVYYQTTLTSEKLAEGYNKLGIDVSGLNSGNYLLSMSYESITQVFKLFVSH